MAKIELDVCIYACWPGNFRVNGIDARAEDFVDSYDHDEENAPDYGCGDRRCDIKDARPEVLEKYGIDVGEYEIVAKVLCAAMDFGECSMCD